MILKRFYLALDFSDKETLLPWADFAFKHKIGIKVGMEAFYGLGPKFIQNLTQNGHHVFLDLKLHDIPNTVLKAVDQIRKLNVDCFTVHATCGVEVWKVLSHMTAPVPLAVTVLTSMEDQDLENIGFQGGVDRMVRTLAQRVLKYNQKNFVCSVHEREMLRGITKLKPYFMCPGLRLEQGDVHDQKRVATLEDLKDYKDSSFVLGRAITGALHPEKAIEKVLSVIH